MNIFGALRLWSKVKPIISVMEDAQMSSKPIWKSRMFWLNILTPAADLVGILPLPPGTVTLVLGLINVALRAITSTPVHVLPRPSD
jgi:hypothetical protein|tara:strand:- start:11369 stop:11626 length:258 start_codon:yes stop_codon:yes gene_type:complete